MERVGNSLKKELLKGLTDEQVAKVKACKNHEELLTLAKQEGVELTQEQLAAVSGGGSDYCQTTPEPDCMYCGSKNVKVKKQSTGVLFDYQFECKCKDCGRTFYIF